MSLKKHIATLPNCVDVTSEHLGTCFTPLGADGLRRTRPQPPAGFKAAPYDGRGMTFIGAEAFRPKTPQQPKAPKKSS